MKWVDGSDTKELLKFYPKEIFLRNYHTLRMKVLLSLVNENKWIVQDQILSEL